MHVRLRILSHLLAQTSPSYEALLHGRVHVVLSDTMQMQRWVATWIEGVL